MGSADPLIGQIVGGRYEVIRLIGRGGMGAIYEVRNTRLGRSFALKTLIGEAAEDAEVIARFRREADVIAKIKHPNIVEVIDWESLADGSPAMVLEYLKGDDLSVRIREVAPLTWPVIGRIGDQILGALSTAHAAGVVHRDLKPQNVFLAIDDSGEEKAKLLDFGVSKIRDSRSLVTTDARLLGTPSYMSPEQAEGRSVDIGPQTDVWAMGAILYEMATGELAFDGVSMPAVLYKICSRAADDVNKKRPDAPPAFVQLVRDALSRDVSARIPTADEFRGRLRDALAEISGLVYTDRVARVSTPMPTRKKRFTGANDKTVSSGNMTAVLPEPGPPSEPKISTHTPTNAGQVSTSTLAPPKRSPALLIGLSAVIAAMTVVVIVLATKHGGQTTEASPPPLSAPKQVVAPAEPIDAAVVPSIDAEVVVATPIDAAVAATKKDPPKKKPDPPKQDPPKIDPPKQDPPKVDPPKQDPTKKKPCKKDDVDCLYGDGT